MLGLQIDLQQIVIIASWAVAVIFEILLHWKIVKLKFRPYWRIGIYFDLFAVTSFSISRYELPSAGSIMAILILIILILMSPFYAAGFVFLVRKLGLSQ